MQIKYHLANGHIWTGMLTEVFFNPIGLNATQRGNITTTLNKLSEVGIDVDEVHFSNGEKLVMSHVC